MSSHGILSDEAIKRAIADGTIRIDPYNEALVNPASYDLTLGEEVTVYKKWVLFDEEYDVRTAFQISRADITGHPRDGSDMNPAKPGYLNPAKPGYLNPTLDVREEPETVTF